MLTSVKRRHGKYTKGKCWKNRHQVDDAMPLENMTFGLGVVHSDVTDGGVRLPSVNVLAFNNTADLVADDNLAATVQLLDLDGTVRDTLTINEDFATSNQATMEAIKADADAISGLSAALSNSNQTITFTAAGDYRLNLVSGPTITSTGAGTATVTAAKSSNDMPAGVNERDENEASVLGHTQTEPTHQAKKKMIGVVRKGDPAVPVTGNVTRKSTPYCMLEDYTDSNDVLRKRGTFCTDNDDGAAPVIEFAGTEFKGPKDADLAPLGINKA